MNSNAPRPRNAPATKTAILEAAREAFALDSFERVGVRDIAERAGVNAALVIRYFGSKESLFAAAVAQSETQTLESVLNEPLPTLGERLARYALGKDASNPSLIALLRSAPNAQAGAMLRAALETQFVRPLAARLTGTHRSERSALVAAQIIGLAVMRSVIAHGGLLEAEHETLIGLVARSLQTLVDEPASPRD
jgi:AcrR family transcriptional regulator